MQKSLTKIFGILFLVVLAGLLIAHFVILRNVRAGFAEKETVFNSQVSDLKQQAEEKTAENRVLKTKLGIAGIRDDVISNNYGTAGDSAKKFRTNLVEGGCKKMDQLNPVFEELDTLLLKKNDTGALASLKQIHDIIFADQPAVTEPKAE